MNNFCHWSRIVQKTNKARLVTDCVPWKTMTSLIIWYQLAEWEVLEIMHFCGLIQYFSSAYGSLKRWLHWLSDDFGHWQSGDAVGDKIPTLEVYTSYTKLGENYDGLTALPCLSHLSICSSHLSTLAWHHPLITWHLCNGRSIGLHTGTHYCHHEITCRSPYTQFSVYTANTGRLPNVGSTLTTLKYICINHGDHRVIFNF